MDTVRWEVAGHHQQLTQTLIVRLLKTHFLHRSLIVKSQQNKTEFVIGPGVSGNVIGKDDGPHAGLARPRLAHQ